MHFVSTWELIGEEFADPPPFFQNKIKDSLMMNTPMLSSKEAREIRRTYNGEAIVSSLAIADIAEKKHKDVLKTIRRVLPQASIDPAKFESRYMAENRTLIFYLLPERIFSLIISGYSAPFRLKLIDHLLQFKKNNASLSQSQETTNILLEQANKRIHELETTIEMFQIVQASSCRDDDVMSISEFCRIYSAGDQLKLTTNYLFALLREMRLIGRKSTLPTNKGMQYYFDYRLAKGSNRRTVVVTSKADKLFKEIISFLARKKRNLREE